MLSLFLQKQIPPNISPRNFLILFPELIRSLQYGEALSWTFCVMTFALKAWKRCIYLAKKSHRTRTIPPHNKVKAIRFAWHDFFFGSLAVYSLLILDAASWYPPLSPAIDAADSNPRQGSMAVIPHRSISTIAWGGGIDIGHSFVFSARNASAIWTSQKEVLIASTLPGDNHTGACFPADCPAAVL